MLAGALCWMLALTKNAPGLNQALVDYIPQWICNQRNFPGSIASTMEDELHHNFTVFAVALLIDLMERGGFLEYSMSFQFIPLHVSRPTTAVYTEHSPPHLYTIYLRSKKANLTIDNHTRTSSILHSNCCIREMKWGQNGHRIDLDYKGIILFSQHPSEYDKYCFFSWLMELVYYSQMKKISPESMDTSLGTNDGANSSANPQATSRFKYSYK